MRWTAVSLSLILAATPGIVDELLRMPVVPPPPAEKPASEAKGPAAIPGNDPWAEATIAKLISESRQAHEKPGGWVIGGDALEALARRDWPRAEPIARGFARSPQPRLRTLALALLCAHASGAEQQKIHDELKAIAADKARPAFSRDRAIETLMARDWPGRDEWLVERMHDPTLGFLDDGDIVYEPISNAVGGAPDRLIPLMVKLLGDPDPAVHSAAANALGDFYLDAARADALRPLIPWLSNPKWAEDHGMKRLRLIQTVPRLGLTDAIPGLVWVVANDDSTNRSYAAESLAELKTSAGNDAMRKALGKRDVDAMDQMRILEALLATNGFTAEELADAVEAFASASDNERSIEATYLSREAADPKLALGAALARRGSDREDAAQLLMHRLPALAKTNPKTAEIILQVIGFWPVASVDRYIVAQLADGTAPPALVYAALGRRDRVRKSAGPQLAQLATRDDLAAGVAAVLLGDADRELQLLAEGSAAAREGVIGAARIVRDPLPLDRVASLGGKSPAVDAYLMADDGHHARELLAARHRGEALLFGPRSLEDPGHTTYPDFDQWEERLRNRVLHEGYDEVIALASGGYWMGFVPDVEIDIKDGKAFLVAKDAPRRPLPPETLSELRAFIATNQADDLPPYLPQIADGVQYEYAHLTRDGGRRLFMNNPGLGGETPYGAIVERLLALAK